MNSNIYIYMYRSQIITLNCQNAGYAVMTAPRICVEIIQRHIYQTLQVLMLLISKLSTARSQDLTLMHKLLRELSLPESFCLQDRLEAALRIARYILVSFS